MLDGLNGLAHVILYRVGVDFEKALPPVRQGNEFSQHPWFTSPEHPFNVAFVADGAAAVEKLIAMSADDLDGRTLEQRQQGLIYSENPKAVVIDGKRVRDAVEYLGEKIFKVWDHLSSPMLSM
jgi:hypothetical protein